MLRPEHNDRRHRERGFCNGLARGAADFDSPVCNVVTGTVLSVHQGLTSTGLGIRTAGNVTIRARWPLVQARENSFTVGQTVVARIPAHAVMLATPGIWPGGERWNRLSGRVVLVDPASEGAHVSAKVQGDNIVLRSTGPVRGLARRPQAWDPVNIVVDPMRVAVLSQREAAAFPRDAPVACSTGSDAGAVWMRGRILSAASLPSGYELSLDIGSVPVKALFERDPPAASHWLPGMEIRLCVSQKEVWIHPCDRSSAPVRCVLRYACE